MSKAFGEENPTQGETAVSWQTWSDGAAGIPDVTGDADWGKLKLDLSGEEGRSAVYDHGSVATRTYTLTENRYGTGAESAILQIRGDTSSFLQDDATPAWETYSAPVSHAWRYVQIRAITVLTLTVLGDSISAHGGIDRWPDLIQDDYLNGSCIVVNHSVDGTRIVHEDGFSDLDDLTTAADDDDADIIFIALGTNDSNIGNMTTLQAELEENIDELQVSNPRAVIYVMNVLPRWTDETGETEHDKSNIRTAISAACAAQGITCWDTYSTHWITADDTADGLHPTADGQIKIAAKVLELLS
jgi:lysophospholipase L1-like esterase